MSESELFEQLDFQENPLYEKLINDLIDKQFSITDSFFTDEEVLSLRNSLLEKYQSDQFKKSAIGSHVNEVVASGIRGDFIKWIDEPNANEAESIFFRKLNSLVNYLNKTCFMGILQKEFHYAVYPEGTYYKRHLDTFKNDDRRKLSFVCYLNDDTWKPENGGELTLYLPMGDSENALDIYPLPGRVVLFESQLLEHEVKIVTHSQRLSITGWLKTR